jgi:hypothetical protein
MIGIWDLAVTAIVVFGCAIVGVVAFEVSVFLWDTQRGRGAYTEAPEEPAHPYRVPAAMPSRSLAIAEVVSAIIPCWLLLRRHRLAFTKACEQHLWDCGEHIACVRCGWAELDNNERFDVVAIFHHAALAPAWAEMLKPGGRGITPKEAYQLQLALCEVDGQRDDPGTTSEFSSCRDDHGKEAAKLAVEARRQRALTLLRKDAE